jgi:hypothetical protein
MRTGNSAFAVPGKGGRPGTPRERWQAAVAGRPLEAPRPLPMALHAMATAITGRARPPLFTTGPATRQALAAAGALGATTGTTVHLPAVPTQISAVLAHELTHTRSPVRRPRFFLGGASGLLDDDERQALSAGKQALSAGQRAGQQAVTAGAGIVDSLPVGGGLGAVGDVATRAAKAAVLEAVASPMGSMLGQAQSFGGTAMGQAQSFAGDAMGAASDAVGGAANGVMSAADDAMSAAGSAVHAVGGAAGAAGGAVRDAAGAAKAALDPDQVVEIVERRLLREIERRGGRWAGMF